MRHTLLGFRAPSEKTAEFRVYNINKDGHSFDYAQRGKSKSNFSQEARFKEAPVYCRGTGQTCYLGPGSYNDIENFKKQKKKPCTAIMKKGTHIDPEESKKDCYIMVG